MGDSYMTTTGFLGFYDRLAFRTAYDTSDRGKFSKIVKQKQNQRGGFKKKRK